MAFRRTPVRIFQLGNPLYANALVTFFEIDGSGNPTTMLITLYTTPNGTTEAANPQTLDSNGRLQFAVFHDEPFVAKIGASEVPDHQTAPWYPDHGGFFQGNWITGFAYIVGDTVRDAATDNVYECLVDHVSGVLATDIGAGKWGVVLNMVAANAAVTAAAAQAVIATTQAGISTTEAGISTTQAGLAAASAVAAAAAVAAVPVVGIDSIASATTTDISPLFTLISITGSATITGLGTAPAGAVRDLRTTGSPTFANGASLIIPWGNDLPAKPNDHFRFVSNGSGVWQLEGYFPAAGPSPRAIVVSGAQALVAGQTYSLEGGAGPLTLPTSATSGDKIKLIDTAGICGIAPVSIVPAGGATINATAGNYSLNIKGAIADIVRRPTADWGVNLQ